MILFWHDGLATPNSYMDTEQYEEAVRDYEKICKMDRSRGRPRNYIIHLMFYLFIIQVTLRATILPKV